jgi:5-methylcytosine-specific restriction protein A
VTNSPTKKDIREAIAKLDRDGIPSGFKESRYFFLVDEQTGIAYPPKAIWGIATKQNAYEFYPKQIIPKLRQLGFYIHDSRLLGQRADDFGAAVKQSSGDSPKQRRIRLADADKKPKTTLAIVCRFTRNPDVVAERLFLAEGHCEKCGKEAPFKRKRDDTPFLEVHHIVPLAEGGDDTVNNCIALCPNCHREEHFG